MHLNKHCTLYSNAPSQTCLLLDTHILASHHRAPVKLSGHINDVSWCKQACVAQDVAPLCCRVFGCSWSCDVSKIKSRSKTEVQPGNTFQIFNIALSRTWRKVKHGIKINVQCYTKWFLCGFCKLFFPPLWAVSDFDWFAEGRCTLLVTFECFLNVGNVPSETFRKSRRYTLHYVLNLADKMFFFSSCKTVLNG